MILHDENHTEISARRNDRPVPRRGGKLHRHRPAPAILAARGPGDREGGADAPRRAPPPFPPPPVLRDHPSRLPAPRGPARPGAARRGLGDDGALRRRGGDARSRPPRAGRQRHHLRRGAAHRMARGPLGVPRDAEHPRPDRHRARRRRRLRADLPRDHPRGAGVSRPGLPGRAADVRRLPLLPSGGRRSASRVRARGALRARRRRRGGRPGVVRRDHPRRADGKAVVPRRLLRPDDVPDPPRGLLHSREGTTRRA